MDIKYSIENVDIESNNLPDIITEQCDLRLHKNISFENRLAIGTITAPFWWNRPRNFTTLVKQTDDKMYSLNLPYIKNEDSYKTDYNILVGTGCLAFLMNINLRDLSAINAEKIQQIGLSAVIHTLAILGVDMSRITKIKNDILYDGKKFVGDESVFTDSAFIEAMVITLNYSKEADLFEKLTGKFAHKRQITGIIEETQLFTKEKFIDTFIKVHHNLMQQF